MLDTEIGQMILVGFRGVRALPESQIVHDIKKDKIGGVVLFSVDVPTHSRPRNIKSPEQVKRLSRLLQSYSKIPLFIAVDEEGGKVARLNPSNGFKPTVSEQYLGTLNNPDTTRFYAHRYASELHNAGINVDLAPVVDLNINPNNPAIGALHRSFSADPKIVINNAKIEINEFKKLNVIAAIKHFPGLGSAHGNPDNGFVNVTQSWQRKELKPYISLIDSGYNGMIMATTVFNARLDPNYPAMLSKPTITGLLRDSLGFHGVVISDDIQAGAVRQKYDFKTAIKLCINAGIDVLTFANNNAAFDPKIADKAFQTIKNLVKEGKISKQRIHQSYQRIMKLKKRLNGSNGG
jgi:beta-N-acetylhexosaminidase